MATRAREGGVYVYGWDDLRLEVYNQAIWASAASSLALVAIVILSILKR